jgi:hypothetical protein
MQLCNDLKNNPGMREEIRFSLEEMSDNLSEEDLQYCIRECQDHKHVVAWCRAELADRRNEVSEEGAAEASVEVDSEKAEEAPKKTSRRRRRTK